MECQVHEAMILRIAFRRSRQGEPKSPGDFSIDNVGVRRGECGDEVGGDIAQNGLFSATTTSDPADSSHTSSDSTQIVLDD